MPFARRLLGSSLVEGSLVGLAAGAVLDGLGTFLYDREDKRSRIAEDLARRNRHVYEVAVSRIARGFGKRLSRKQEQRYGWRFHQAFGLLTGVGYALVRRRFPRVGRMMGLGFGVAFYLGVDELLMPALGLSPGPQRFGWKVHGRGAASHIAYGIAAEAAARTLDGFRTAIPA